MNAIDPCAFFDQEGNMWMVYGSWFGGLYMLKLDASTGLRDKSYTYATTDGTAIGATSDAYQGIKLAGGNHMSGEAPYIEYYNGKYYLFVTYGGLTANGGYNMRIFTSDSVTGPYTDISGQDARYTSNNTSVGNVNGSVGARLMSYYRWNHMPYGYTAQGHNSAVVDTDNRMFLVYHTRFDDGTEGHQVRVHQLFQTKSKYLTAAPFQYRGESLPDKSFSIADVAGEYGALSHTPTNYSSLECVKEKTLRLNEDGTISGSFSGSWSLDADGPYITLRLGTSTYEGVLLTQQIENSNDTRLCLTAIGNNDYSLWGYKRIVSGSTFDETTSMYLDIQSLNLPSSAYAGTSLNFPTKGSNGSNITWQSSNEAVIDNEGNVADATVKTYADITCIMTLGEYSYSQTQRIDVLPSDNTILGYYPTITDFANAKPNTNITQETGLSISFNVSGLASDWDIIAQSTDNKYTMYLSVLRYNGCDHYEAAATMSDQAKQTDVAAWQLFLNGSYKATISYNPDGSITYYRDDVLMLTYAPNAKASYPSTGTVTPSVIVPAVINYYLNDKINFTRNVSNIIIGYSVKYREDNSPTTNVESNRLIIRNYGNKVILLHKNSADPVEIYNSAGQLIHRDFDDTVTLPHNGMYIVKVNNIAKRILICRK
jgi:beta-xylosidase